MFIKHLDILSDPLYLHYENFHSHSSIPSSILSILTLATCIAFALIFIKDIFYHLNPTSFCYTRQVEDAGIFPINESSMFHFFTFKNIPINESTESLIEIFGMMDNSETIVNYKDNLGNRSLVSHYTYSKCPQKSSKYKYNHIENLILEKPLINGFCISGFYDAKNNIFTSVNDKNFIHPVEEHGTSHPNYTSYQILIQKCQNDTFNNFNNCKSSEYIDKILTENQVDAILEMMNQEVDVNNFSTPIINKLIQIRFTFAPGSTVFSLSNLNFQPLKVKTHKSLVFDEWYEENSYYFEQNDIKNYASNFPIYTSYQFWMQNKIYIYERYYKKIQNFLADIGGTIKALTTIARVINLIFYKYQTYKDIEKIMMTKINNIKKNEFFFLKNDTSKRSFEDNKKQIQKISFLNNSDAKFNNYVTINKSLDASQNKLSKFHVEKNITYKFIPFNFLKDNSNLGTHISFCEILWFLIIRPDHHKTKKGKYVDIIKWYYRQVISEQNLFDLYFFCSKIEKNEETSFRPYDFIKYLK